MRREESQPLRRTWKAVGPGTGSNGALCKRFGTSSSVGSVPATSATLYPFTRRGGVFPPTNLFWICFSTRIRGGTASLGFQAMERGARQREYYKNWLLAIIRPPSL